MDIFKKSINEINKFFKIDLRVESSIDEIFDVMHGIIRYDSAYIFYVFPDSIKLEYTRNSKLKKQTYTKVDDINFNCKHKLIAELKIDNTIFAILVITRGTEFTKDETSVYSVVSDIISSLVKNIELNNIISLQVKAQQESITELNKAYKTIEKQNKKILKADKIKSDFIANISHELRTPLNSIIGFSDLLVSKCLGELTPRQLEYVNDIKVSGLHLLGMINEILDMSKIESGAMHLNRTIFSTKQAIDEVLNIIEPLALKKDIMVVRVYGDETINADYQKFQQILFNLLSNAIKYTPEKGTIKINCTRAGDELTLKIKDNGKGIDKKYQKTIFKKFEQGPDKGAINSTGLGLTITRELAALHGGKITLKSEEGKGAEFIVTLPC